MADLLNWLQLHGHHLSLSLEHLRLGGSQEHLRLGGRDHLGLRSLGGIRWGVRTTRNILGRWVGVRRINGRFFWSKEATKKPCNLLVQYTAFSYLPLLDGASQLLAVK